MKLQSCLYRLPFDDKNCFCASLNTPNSDGMTPLTFCETCDFAEPEPPTDIASPITGMGDMVAKTLSAIGVDKKDGCGCGSRQAMLNRLLPFTGAKQSKDWSVTVTAAPRREPTLIQTVNSLRAAGWEPVVFAEPGIVPLEAVETIKNQTVKGVWHNWLQAARWSLKNTRAKYILTVQDDIVFHPGSKTFVDSILWPSENCGFISLYTPKHYQLKKGDATAWPIGIRQVKTRSLWGACALVWPRSVLAKVVEHVLALNWQGVLPKGESRSRVAKSRKENSALINNSDTAIGKIMNRMAKEMWYLDPSPSQHISRFSTINHGGNTGRRNCYRCADSEQPLIEQIPVPDDFVKYTIP